MTRLDEPGASATLDSARPISLRFSEPLAIRDVLLMLVRGTGLSLVTEPGVDGTFMGELSAVTVRQALGLVLRPHGLDYALEGTAIRVFRRRTETRFLDLNIAGAVRRAEGRTATASSLPADPANESRATVSWSIDGNAFDEIGAGIRALLSPDGRSAVDRRAGLVQVTDYPEHLDRIATYVETVERRLLRQVDIQARVIEVVLADPAATSVNWTAALARARTSPERDGVAPIDFDALVKALADQGAVTVLAAPRVQAMHNEPALMRLGTRDVTFERDGDRQRATSVLDGFALLVTPHITADGLVMMNVERSVTQRTGEKRSRDRQDVPVMTVDEVSTSVCLRDGDTLVLPGLRREREAAPAAAAKGLAALFRRQPAQKTHSELAVLLTPKVM